jgi:hypothetical protein
MKLRLVALGLVLALVAVAGLMKVQGGPRLTAEERAFWEANSRKVKEGWEKGSSAGKVLAQNRLAAGEYAMASRDLATIADSSLKDSGINDSVTADSFNRGFVFGFQQARARPEEQ